MNNSVFDVLETVIHIQGVINLVILALGLTMAGLLLILLAHLSYSLTKHSVMYRSRSPVDGWNKKFYPAMILMLLSLGGLAWWLEIYKHNLTP